jgi:hypothetical protein
MSRCACADVGVLNQVSRGGAGRRVHRGCAAQCACPGGLVVASAGTGDRPEFARALPLIGRCRPRKGGTTGYCKFMPRYLKLTEASTLLLALISIRSPSFLPMLHHMGRLIMFSPSYANLTCVSYYTNFFYFFLYCCH